MNQERPIRSDALPAATPMMEQFIEIKAANPDSLLFYRMGDFYELFFDDALTASRALGITLTKRGKHLGEDIPMCGVPVHAADDYLQKLIGLGHRVAVCEQMEDPTEARKRGSKSVVRRDVVRLVTPGTITEEKLLAPSESNHLMALGRVRGEDELALAWIDISTGSFLVATTAADRLLADILRIDPRELIVAEPVFHDPLFRPVLDMLGRIVTPLPPSLFDSGAAAERAGTAPLARIVAAATVGVPPHIMGIGPAPAIRALLDETGLSLDRIEINEAFGAQILACIRELGLDEDKTNVNGGAIAIGHPLGATGVRITTTVARELKRSGLRYGIASACIGGGQGIAVLVVNPEAA